MTHFQHPGIPARIRAQQVYALTQLTSALMIVNLVNSLTLVLVLYATDQFTPAIAIWAAVVSSVSLHALYRNQRQRLRAPPKAVSQTSVQRVIRSATLFGLIWVFPGLFVLPSTVGDAQVFMAALITGMICGGAISLYPIPQAAVIYSGLVTVGALAGMALAGNPAVIGLTVIAACFFFIFSKVIERHAQLFVAEFVTRLDLEESHKSIAQLNVIIKSEAAEKRRR